MEFLSVSFDGGFGLIELIGQGGMGQVWRAQQVSVQRQIALKLVRPEMVTEKTLDLFAREARAGARFHHPGIVDVFDHGTSEGIAWIAMEFVEGAWTLRDFLNDVAQQDDLPEHYYRDVARFVVSIADAMEAVHAQGVIHRDLKPQNILIAPDDTPKVTDFGLARTTDESALSMTGDFAGTYYYISPEQVAARRMGIDHRTDVFSLGIVLYEMLAGRRPFEGDTTHQVATQIVTKDPPKLRTLRSRIPRDLAVITGKCLEKDPDRRYATMMELAADIRRHLSLEPILAEPPGRARKTWLWAQRNPTKSVAGGVAALAFGAISMLLVWNVRTNRDLTRTGGERDTAIENLLDQTRVAKAAANAEKARADEVLGLSALRTYDELLIEANDLWPAEPANISRFEDWITRAEDVIQELPRIRDRLTEWRAMAIPQSDEERALDRANHPDVPALRSLERRVLAKRCALERRRGGADIELPALSAEELALGALVLNERAWQMVRPSRASWGDEARGLSLALRALTLAEPSEDDTLLAPIGDTVARAFAALGRDKEALAASTLALERAADSDKAKFRSCLEAIKKETEASASAKGLAAAEAELAALEAEVSALAERVNERQDWRFPETEEGASALSWHTNFSKLIQTVEILQHPESGLLSSDLDAVSADHGWSMRRRLAHAQGLRDEMHDGEEHAHRWQEAIASIVASEKYGGLELVPQAGLVPIGMDPQSGLWEFWHVATGKEPARDDEKRLILTGEMGVVLVVIPGGKFWMGATADPGASHNFDEQADSEEGPVHEVELTTYFLSKYELAQEQWLRFSDRLPRGIIPADSLPRETLRPWSK